MAHTMILVGVMALVLGVTALWIFLLRRKLQDQTEILRQSESKFRSLVEKSLVGVYIIQDDRFVYVNPRHAQIFGYTAEEMTRIGSVFDTVIPEDRDSVREQIQRRISGDLTTVHYVFRGVCRDGSEITVEVLGSLTEFNGKPAVLGTALDITHRRRAEEELFNSRQMLRTVLDTIPQRVFWKDRNLTYLGCNMPFAQDCGWADPAEVVGKVELPLHSPEMAQACLDDDRRILETGESRLNFELQIATTEGRSWLRMSKVPLYDKNGETAGMLGTYEDVTDYKRAQTALAETSQLLEIMLNNSPDCIYFKDRESRFVHTSKSLAQLFRVNSPEDLKGKSDFDFFLEEHARAAFEDEQRILNTGEPIVGKPEKETHADGRNTWALTTKLPWYDKNGTIIGTFGISKDVTAIKEAETQLKHERELFHALVDNLPDAIYFKDRHSRFVRLSRSKIEQARQFLLRKHQTEAGAGGPPAHLGDIDLCAAFLIGKTDFDVMQPDRARSAMEEEQEILKTGTPLIGKIEKVLRAEDGAETWLHTTKMPWRDTDGTIIGTFGVTRDITALKAAEAQLEAAHQRLVETSRLAGMAEVATDVLHNVGNVLNSVNVSCSITIDRVRSSKMSNVARVSSLLDEHRDHLGEFLSSDPRGQQIPQYLGALAAHLAEDQSAVVQELEQLLKHVDHIKQIVAMQQSYAKVAGVKEMVTAEQLIDDALQINAAALKRHQVTVEKQVHEAPPLMTEKHKVLQILVNLIRNAKYALDESKRQDKILKLVVDTDGNSHARIRVIDNGIGIASENITRIFGHGFTTRRNGHGFGLHSSALAVRELDGSLHAESAGIGHGATFTLLLPCTSERTLEQPQV